MPNLRKNLLKKLSNMQHKFIDDFSLADLILKYNECMKGWKISPQTILAVGVEDIAFEQKFCKAVHPGARFVATSAKRNLHVCKVDPPEAVKVFKADIVVSLNPLADSDQLTDVINNTRKYLLLICIDFEHPFPEVFSEPINDYLHLKMIAKHINVN
ncbi:hypothetical protein [Beihai mantis shrimp virus 2]|uniref:hypothetical protein n=1 Tax=Beihai mantis shrimp virus 2 TaxID=1922429 RepID=UPI00090BDBB1|nr:hypothetical protein [Beihai mantis shrimp virus 2]APG77579.1 hypothetical protein [Beihai mantis shrimp virus 2]